MCQQVCISPGEFRDLLRAIGSDGIISELDIEPDVARLLVRVLSQSAFVAEGPDRLSCFTKATPAGTPWLIFLFVLLMAKIIRGIRHLLVSQGLVFRPSVLEPDCSYIDDAAFWHLTSSHATVLEASKKMVEIVVNTFKLFLFRSNFKPGKSQLASRIIGKDPPKQLVALGPHNKRFLEIPFQNSPSIPIRIFPTYKHVGRFFVR